MHGLSHYSSSKLKQRNRTSRSQTKTKGTKSQTNSIKSQTNSIKSEDQNMSPSPVRQRSSRSKPLLSPAKFVYEPGPSTLQQECKLIKSGFQLSPMQSSTTFDEEPRFEWAEQPSPSKTKIFSESTFAAFETQSSEYLPAMHSVVHTETATDLTKSVFAANDAEAGFNRPMKQTYNQETANTNPNGPGIISSPTPPTFTFGDGRTGAFKNPTFSVPENQSKSLDTPNPRLSIGVNHNKNDVSRKSPFSMSENQNSNKEDGKAYEHQNQSRSKDSTRSRVSTKESESAKRTKNVSEKRKKRASSEATQIMGTATGNPEEATDGNKHKRSNHKAKTQSKPPNTKHQPGIGDCNQTKPPVSTAFPFNVHRHQKTGATQPPVRPGKQSKATAAITEAISKTTLEEDSVIDEEEAPPKLPVVSTSTRSVVGTSKHAIGACFALTSHALLMCFVLAEVGGIPTHKMIDHMVNASEGLKIVKLCQDFISKIKASKLMFSFDSLNKNIEN